MSDVEKAIVPAAGRGSRMRPLTDCVPKALLPVGEAPLLGHALRELARAGIRRVAIVVAPGMNAAREVVRFAPQLEIEFREQPTPRGLADALLCAGDFAGNDPVACLNPDMLHGCAGGAMQQVLATRDPSQVAMAMVRVTPQNAVRLSASGRARTTPLGGQRHRVDQVFTKDRSTRLDPQHDRFKLTGRYVFPAGFLQSMVDDDTANGEHDDTPSLMRWALAGQLLGIEVPGDLFDCGNFEGYRAAWQALLSGDLPQLLP
jgi:UTP-glucose-1-phosphate uridylyltransferase